MLEVLQWCFRDETSSCVTVLILIIIINCIMGNRD